ncbi:TlyA family RNA methyltransferase [Clostridium sp. SYSU_GA19001]|uniref:TlyA family RNA methyltransferase n=1 Tax=Clostridium caldaquaticum TaxID=2940653 RepID=UPI0020770843|nr:TlyA family RNA methyltransferase [Clostridium caldaquaticum]MCM8711051.1 TlyA family RNA methyltransferase [Clostridium caldaquaticum]
MSETKERLDVLLVNKGMFSSREKARASIMAGQIFVEGQRIDKCGEKVKKNANIEFKGEQLPYVSRGGLKLEKAVNTFNIKLKDKICFDIGASTGGFTDCMLQNGARKVVAIDVGYGQFAWKLRTDPRVLCLERTNVRYVTLEQVGEIGDFASIDVSFISLKKVIEPVVNLLNDNGEVMALIKPQFEAGREKVGKKGVVKEPSTHKEVIYSIANFILDKGMKIINLDYSPIRGPEGNIEYLIYFTKDKQYEGNFEMGYINKIVEYAHDTLK